MSTEEKKSSIFSRFYNRVRLAVMPQPLPVISSLTLQFPVLMPLRDIYSKLRDVSNKYELYRTLYEVDSELYGAIDRITKMVRYAYQGVFLHVDRKLDTDEKNLLKELKKLELQYNFPALVQSIASRLLLYGDDVSIGNYEKGSGLTELQFLPLEATTIVEKEDQLLDPLAQIFKKNIYVLNESTEDKRQTWSNLNQTTQKVQHFSLNNAATVVYDIVGRYTFGVWSLSPVESLRTQLLWKLATKINDILVRQKIIPRGHHKLDLSAFDPRYYSGDTIEARHTAAKTAAKSFIDDYKKDVATPLKEADKDFITGKEVEISYIEPKKVTYIDPNPLIDQINQSIFAALGPIETAVTGRGRRTFATELVVSSYATLCAETLADIVRQGLITMMRRHMLAQSDNKIEPENLAKIDAKFELVLDILRGENVRQFAIMSAVPVFTDDELRAVLAYEPLTDEQRKSITARGGPGRVGQHAQTIEDILRDYQRRREPVPEPVTPESERERTQT